jgi:hypothetical protein
MDREVGGCIHMRPKPEPQVVTKEGLQVLVELEWFVIM